MIKANELRIGNYVLPLDLDHPVQITAIDHDIDGYNGYFAKYNCGSFTIEDDGGDTFCEPILLTKDWLTRFGAINNGQDIFDFNGFTIRKGMSDLVWSVYYFDNFITNLKYVHQLQNLYFALTGEELEIAQPI